MSNFEKSKSVVLQAFTIASKDNYIPNSKFKSEIAFILSENHKTYKYITINALIAKAALPSINPLCLQKKSKLEGAYDARSHCHKVLVPFERNYLNGALGNSNEPFLNKPARFEELSKSNAVRNGRDKQLLFMICDMLSQITDEKLAFSALTDSLYYAIELSKNKFTTMNFKRNSVSTKVISDFLHSILEKSYGGETLSLAIGSIMKAYVKGLKGQTQVQVHKINQSGASSKEISDIDVYLDSHILYTIEAKDKIFTEYDVEHAFTKSAQSGASNIFFIIGPRGEYTGTSKTPNELIEDASLQGINLILISYKAFIHQLLSLTVWNEENELFINFVHEIFKEAQVKDETISYILEKAAEFNLID